MTALLIWVCFFTPRLLRYGPRIKPLPVLLPPTYTVRCVAGQWLIEAPAQGGPHKRAPYRRRIKPPVLRPIPGSIGLSEGR